MVHELSRILVRTFFAIPPRWRQRVEGLEHVDRKKSYVIVLNHNTVIDIPTLYYIPLNFRWVSKREVFKTPFFGQYLILHGDICINRGRASRRWSRWCATASCGSRAALRSPSSPRVRVRKTVRYTASRRAPSRWPGRGRGDTPVVLDGTKTLIRKNAMFNWGNRITIRVLPPVPAGRSSRPRRTC